MAMSAMENFQRVLSGDSPGWIPFTLSVGAIPGFAEAFQQAFEEKTGEADASEYFDYDFRLASLSLGYGGVDPAKHHGQLPEGTVIDEWGVGHWAGGAQDTPARMFPPLAEVSTPDEVESLPEPSIDSSSARKSIDEYHHRGYPVMGYAGSVYEWSWWLRGMQRFMMDLVLNPDLAQAIFDKVSGFTLRLALESARAGVDVLAFYDDAGTQSSMQISPDLWRRFVKPAWQRVITAVREKHPHVAFFLHSCGNIRPVIGDIVEIGFDILHPIQPECLNAAEVKREFGDQIVLCATLGSQDLLPFGSSEDVRRETMRLMDVMGDDRRCILCPSNRIQPETPWENIEALAQTARTHRGGRDAL